jgi:hypothetical protein
VTDAFSQIKVRPVDPIGQPDTAGNTYINTSNSYDCAIAGQPFFFGISDKYPYKRETAQYRKQQIDMQKEPGEQTLTGWWLRAQSSFHYGAGIRFQEPVQGDTVTYRFNKSAGVDVFNTGKVTLLPDVTILKSATNNNIILEGGVDTNDVDIVLMADNASLYRITGIGASTALTWGGSGTILDVAQDGQNYYVANATGIYKGPLTGATNGTLIFTHPASVGTVTNVKMNWAKQRLIAGVNNFLFEITPITSFTVTAGSLSNNVATLKTDTVAHNFLVGSQVTVASISAGFNGTFVVTGVPSATEFSYYHNYTDQQYATGMTGTAVLATNNTLPIYVHPNAKWIWTGVTEGPNAIYTAGYAGDSSAIFRLSLDTQGNVPLLSKAVTAADMPAGEIVTSLASYIGKYMVFGTNKGVRVGQIDTSGYVSSGFITYGPLTVVTNGYDPSSGTNLTGKEVNAIMFQDRYAYCTVSNYIDNGDGTFSSGLVKLDLSKEIGPNLVAYATHLRVPTTNDVVDVAVFGHSNNIVIGVKGKGSYVQTANLCASGYIQTGLIRYLTLEDKHFKLIKIRAQTPVTGNIGLSAIAADGNITPIITVNSNFDLTQDITTGLSQPVESLAFRFTLYPSVTDATVATTLNGYQLKALPAVRRARLYSVPVLNFDFEGDRYNMVTGYEGRAIARLQALETMEAIGDVIVYQDFTSGETIQGVIDSLQFVRTTPPERRFTGFGGVIYATIRSI